MIGKSTNSIFNFDFSLSNSKRELGYVAISSMLIISAVVLSIIVSVSLLSISEIQMALAGKERIESIGLVEACIEESLLQLNGTNALPSTITLPEGSCTVTINAQTGNNWTFTVSATQDAYTKSIQVTANRASVISLTSWQEQ